MTRQAVKGSETRGGPTKAQVPLDEFVALLYEHGSSYKVGKVLGIDPTSVIQRRKWIEEQLQVELPKGRPEVWRAQAHRRHIDWEIENGSIIIGGDAHCWPEIFGVAMTGFVDFSRRFKPEYTIINGDGLDGAQISRHPRMGWDQRPKVVEELEATKDFYDQILKANPNSKRKRTRGNHDARFDNLFSNRTPEAEGIFGTCLQDHLPGWEEVMSITVNNECVIQHRYRGGIHAIYNNVRDFGCHIITSHRHQQEVKPLTNYMGTWWGADTGCLAPIDHPAFDYTELKRPPNWRSGFLMLTFSKYKLMPPEPAFVLNEERGELYFRGNTFKYSL